MIQRIQSIYLLLTIIFSVLFLQGDFIKFTLAGGGEMMINLPGIYKAADSGEAVRTGNSILLSILVFLIPVLSLITIFLYRKRKLQLRFAVSVIMTIVILILSIGYYYYYVSANFNAEIAPGVRLIIPFLMLICSFLAYRGIKKDDEIVKSYDRLR